MNLVYAILSMLSPLVTSRSSFMTHGTTHEVGRFFVFYEFIEYLPVAEPGGPKYGSDWGWASTVMMGGHD